jgi:hypothetical protein
MARRQAEGEPRQPDRARAADLTAIKGDPRNSRDGKVATASGTKVAHPYSPSWLNRLIDWIDARPGPAWAYYLGGIILLGLAITLGRWLVGDIPVGTLSVNSFFYAVYPIYLVALMHYLDRHATSALEKFRPALQVDDAEYSRIEYELTTVPAGGAWLATALAMAIGLWATFRDGGEPLVDPGQIAGFIVVGINTLFSASCLFVVAYHTVRQLKMVSRVHAAATNINLLQAWPLYAFSELTAQTGIGLVFFVYLNLALSPPDATDPFTYLLMAIILAVAAAAFVFPLFGMHERLAQEKRQFQSKINGSVEVAYQELEERVQLRNFAGIDDLDKALSSLLNLREVAAKIPTWPWRAETLRGFISALLVPILIWLLTRILERFITF